MEGKTVLAALVAVQRDLKAPKNQYNNFGKYKYRSCEDILSAARPLCNEHGLVLAVSDMVETIGSRFYIKAVASVVDIATGDTYSTTAYAREEDSKKGMDAAQLTGATSSYARKYALCGLFAIDDNRDADSGYGQQDGAEKPQNTTQGNHSRAGNKDSVVREIAELAKKNGVTKDEILQILVWKFKVDSSSKLAYGQTVNLKNNLLQYVQELRKSA